jgi:hypothetical protein
MILMLFGLRVLYQLRRISPAIFSQLTIFVYLLWATAKLILCSLTDFHGDNHFLSGLAVGMVLASALCLCFYLHARMLLLIGVFLLVIIADLKNLSHYRSFDLYIPAMFITLLFHYNQGSSLEEYRQKLRVEVYYGQKFSKYEDDREGVMVIDCDINQAVFVNSNIKEIFNGSVKLLDTSSLQQHLELIKVLQAPSDVDSPIARGASVRTLES